MSLEWNKAHRQQKYENDRRYRRRLKLAALEAYGGKCDECGETEPDLLEIDHIHGFGNEHRERLFGYGHASPGGWNFYLWLKKNRWPEGFRVRCRTCHPRERRTWDRDE